MTILAIERFDLLATIRKIKAPVGQDAVDIEYDCPDIPGFFQYMLHVSTCDYAQEFASGCEATHTKKSVHLAQGFLIRQLSFAPEWMGIAIRSGETLSNARTTNTSAHPIVQ